jgi:hypothetical protein
MRNTPNLRAERYRIAGPPRTNSGSFMVPFGPDKQELGVIVSDGGGWDHVSVSLHRFTGHCPSWEIMCFVKELFFRDDETVMQLHPPRATWINNYPTCLHLWRPQTDVEIAVVKAQWGAEWPYEVDLKSPGLIPLPPGWMVGVKGIEPEQMSIERVDEMRKIGEEQARKDFQGVDPSR